MLPRFQYARTTTVTTPARRAWLVQTRTRTAAAPLLQASTDVAKQLDATGNWKRGRERQKLVGPQAKDPRKVNIVSDRLCDDIIKYIGPSLERHRGCDLIDLNPGVGVWSRKLHSFLEPRRHVMMDLDAELYRPFLADLLAKDGVDVIPQSGLVWKHLASMLQTHLLDLEDKHGEDPPQRNDTLLVTANLSTYPKKAFRGFDNVSSMVLYQFMSSIRVQSLFQRYGLVRMLVWVNDEDKRRLLPQSINRRKRSAIEAEFSCDWVHEVGGLDVEFQDRNALRDEWINLESGYAAVARMETAGLAMPTGRETATYTEVKANPELAGQKLAGERPPVFQRPYRQEMAKLQGLEGSKSTRKDPERLETLRRRAKYIEVESLAYLDLLQQRERIFGLATTSPPEFDAADKAWNKRIDDLKKNPRNEFSLIKDSSHLYRQNPSVLLWDRRQYEPLSVQADEFYPNAPSALLDIQPKAMHPLLREHGPGSSRSGDMADLMLRSWLISSANTIPEAMEALWGGFGSQSACCPSVGDAGRGGSPMTGHGALTVRAMNEEQWVEVMQAWMDWPFRPTYEQMVGRLMDDGERTESEDDDLQPSMGLGG